MLEHIAHNKGYTPIPSPQRNMEHTADGLESIPGGRAVARAGAGRLKDAIVFGYMMQRHRARGKVQLQRGKGGGGGTAADPLGRNHSYSLLAKHKLFCS